MNDDMSSSAVSYCKGSFVLGTACGECERCFREAPAAAQTLYYELAELRQTVRDLPGQDMENGHRTDVQRARRIGHALMLLDAEVVGAEQAGLTVALQITDGHHPRMIKPADIKPFVSRVLLGEVNVNR